MTSRTPIGANGPSSLMDKRKSQTRIAGNVSRVAPIQRSAADGSRIPSMSSSRPPVGVTQSETDVASSVTPARSKLLLEQTQTIKDLETQIGVLTKKNIELQREMQEAMGLHQLKTKAVENLTKDLNGQDDLKRQVGIFLEKISISTLDGALEEVQNLRKKCSRSEEYLSELNEKYREEVLKCQKLEKALIELRSEKMIDDGGDATKGQQKSKQREDLKNLAIRNATLERQCEAFAEIKEKLVKVEIEKRDLKAQNTQLKGKMTTLQRENKKLEESLKEVTAESNKKIGEMKEATAKHLEMLSKIRRSHTRLDTKYKHLLKERTQWQSLFRTANGELSRSTESLASVSSVASSVNSRMSGSFFRESSNLEEYNIHLESEVVALKENVKILEKEKERLEKKLKTLGEQIIEDETLITELDQSRALLSEERDKLNEKCAALEAQNIVLQRNVDEMRDQLDVALFENNEMSLREGTSVAQPDSLENSPVHETVPRLIPCQTKQPSTSPFNHHRSNTFPDSLNSPRSSADSELNQELLLQAQHANVEVARALMETMHRTQKYFVQRLDSLNARLDCMTLKYKQVRSLFISRSAETFESRRLCEEYRRQISVLTNNAESLAQDLVSEMSPRNISEIEKLQDEINVQKNKLKDYEKVQKVLKKALVENETLKESEKLLQAKLSASESQTVQLSAQLREEQEVIRLNSSRFSDELAIAEKKNEMLESEVSLLREQVKEVLEAKQMFIQESKDNEGLSLKIAEMTNQIDKYEKQITLLNDELQKVSNENRDSASKLEELTIKLVEALNTKKALEMTLNEKGQHLANVIRDLETERKEKEKTKQMLMVAQKQEHQLHEASRKQLSDKESKMAQLAEEVKDANKELERILSDKSSTIEQLQKEVSRAKEMHERCDNLQFIVDQISSYVFDLAEVAGVQPLEDVNATLKMVLSAIRDRLANNQSDISELQRSLEIKEGELQDTRNKTHDVFVQTVEELKHQLSKDEDNLRRYEDALENQTAVIEKMKIERSQLEKDMKQLRENDERNIEILKKKIESLTQKLELANERCKEFSLVETKLVELEAKLKVTVTEKDTTISDLEERLETSSQELDCLKRELKSFESLIGLDAQIKTLESEMGKCHETIDKLQRELDEKDANLVAQGQLIAELESDLGEQQKCNEVNTEKIATLQKECQVHSDDEKILRRRLDSLTKENDEYLAKIQDLQKNFTNAISEQDSYKCRVDELTEQMKELQTGVQRKHESLERLKVASTNVQSELNSTKESLAIAQERASALAEEKLLLEETLSTLRSQLELKNADVLRLEKAVAEAEGRINGITEQRNEEMANMMQQINAGLQERELLEKQLKEKDEACNGEVQTTLEKLSILAAEHESLKRDKMVLEEHKEKLDEALAAAESNFCKKSEELEHLKTVLEQRKNDVVRFEKQLQTLKEKYNDKLQKMEKSVNQTKAEKADLASKMNDLQMSLQECSNALEKARDDNQKLLDRKSKLEKDLDSLSCKYDAILEQIDSINEDLENANERMDQNAGEMRVLSQSIALAREECLSSSEDFQGELESPLMLKAKKSLQRNKEQVQKCLLRVSSLETALSEKDGMLQSIQATKIELESDHEQKLVALIQEREKLEKELVDVKKFTEEQKQLLDQLSQDLKTENTNNQKLKEELAQAAKDLELERASSAKTQESLDMKIKELDSSKQEILASNEVIKNLKSDIGVCRENLRETELKLSEALDKSNNLAEQIVVLEEQLKNVRYQSNLEIESLMKNQSETEAMIVHLKSEAHNKEVKFNELRESNRELENDLSNLRDEAHALKSTLMAVEGERNALQEKVSRLHEEMKTESDSMDQMDELLKSVRNELESKTDALLKLERQREQETQRLEETIKDLTTKEEVMRLKADQLTSEIDQVLTKCGLLQASISERDEKIEIMEGSAKRSSEEKVKLEQELKDLRKHLEEVAASKTDMEIQLQNVNKDLSAKSNDCDKLRKKIKDLEDSVEDLKKQVEEKNSIVVALEKDNDKLSSRKAELKTQLSEAYDKLKTSDEDMEAMHQLKKKFKDIEVKATKTSEELDRVMNCKQGLETKIVDLGTEIESLKAQCSKISYEKEELEDKYEAVRKELAQSERLLNEVKLKFESAEKVSKEVSEKAKELGYGDFLRDWEIERNEFLKIAEETQQIRAMLGIDKEQSLIEKVRTEKQRLSKLSTGVKRIHKDLHNYREEMATLKSLLREQKSEISSLVNTIMSKTSERVLQTDKGSLSRMCLKVLRGMKVQSVEQLVSRSLHKDDMQRISEMMIQTFNGPCAQFVAEQQAARYRLEKHKSLDVTVTDSTRDPTVRDDARSVSSFMVDSSDNARPLRSNGECSTSSSALLRTDPYETIKQQKVLIHELMAKLESSKRKQEELLRSTRQTSSVVSRSLSNAEVSSKLVTGSTGREDTFDSVDIISTERQLIPENSLSVTRQFPSYVESFIRWLVATTPTAAPSSLDSQNIANSSSSASSVNRSFTVSRSTRQEAGKESQSRII